MNATTVTEDAKEKLIKDFRAVVTDTEELLKATASQTGEKVAAARAKVEESLAATRKRLADLEQGLIEKTRAADELVHEHPWQAVGIAAAVGFLLGMLTTRRS